MDQVLLKFNQLKTQWETKYPPGYFSYKFDSVMVQKRSALILLLLLTGVFCLVGGIVYYLLHSPGDLSLLECIFRAWTFVADPGTHAGEEGFGSRVASFVITLGGFLSFAILLGLVGDTISDKIEHLRRGRNKIIESNHVLIIGWSEKIYCFLENMAIANESEGGMTVVILAGEQYPPDKIMELLTNNCSKKTLNESRIICRTGHLSSVNDLKRVAADKAKCICIMANEEDKAASDARTLRIVLALVRGFDSLAGHIVVEVISQECSELIELAGQGHVVPLVSHEMIGRMLIQCARQPGLSAVYMNLLCFDDSEFYMEHHEGMGGNGRTYEDICYLFDGAVVCGYHRDGKLFLNPPDDTPILEDDMICVLAEDDSTYFPRKERIDVRPCLDRLNPDDFRNKSGDVVLKPTKLLFCGWRQNMEQCISTLGAFLNPGSEVTVMKHIEDRKEEKKIVDLLNEWSPKSSQINIKLIPTDPQSRKELKAVVDAQDVTGKPFRSIIVLSNVTAVGSEDELDKADSLVLITTLFLEDIIKQKREASPSYPAVDIISEIFNPNTKASVSEPGKGDWIVSNELISMALAQLAENKENRQIWNELFVPEGNELYLTKMEEYLLHPDEEVCFWDLYVRGKRKQEVVIGWVLPAPSLKPVINPEDKWKTHKFAKGTRVALLALGAK